MCTFVVQSAAMSQFSLTGSSPGLLSDDIVDPDTSVSNGDNATSIAHDDDGGGDGVFGIIQAHPTLFIATGFAWDQVLLFVVYVFGFSMLYSPMGPMAVKRHVRLWIMLVAIMILAKGTGLVVTMARRDALSRSWNTTLGTCWVTKLVTDAGFLWWIMALALWITVGRGKHLHDIVKFFEALREAEGNGNLVNVHPGYPRIGSGHTRPAHLAQEGTSETDDVETDPLVSAGSSGGTLASRGGQPDDSLSRLRSSH